jgi:hypothetical protein
MGRWLAQRARLKPDCFDLRYEDLVSRFEDVAKGLIDFLGLPWDEAVLHYHEHARGRHIATPSYSQVLKPIYRSAMGRWERYARYFEAVLPTLHPYLKAFGYSPSSYFSGGGLPS